MEKKNVSKKVPKNKIHKKVVAKNKQKPLQVSTNLLLSYIYSINSNFSKLITVGFDPNCFVARVILNDVNNDKIVIDSDEWYLLFGKQRNINDTISQLSSSGNFITPKEHDKTSLIVLSDTLMISIEKDGAISVKICQRSNISLSLSMVTLTQNEWEQLNNCMEFINLVITHYRSCTPIIKMYFDIYVDKCIQQEKSALDSADYFFFNDVNNVNKINYSRLFHEIPSLCKDQIHNRLTNKQNVI